MGVEISGSSAYGKSKSYRIHKNAEMLEKAILIINR